jgi:hypothetical protein
LSQTRGAKKIPKTYTLVFGKYLVVSFQSPLIKAFSVFLEDSLELSQELDVLGKILKTDSDSAHQN